MQGFMKMLIRNLRIRKSSALINIIGLSIGIASSLIIFLFVFYETNYDRFHKNVNNIYKVFQHSMVNGEVSFDGVTPVPMAATLLSDYPEVLNAVRIYQADNIYAVADHQYFRINHALYVDSSFFGVFSFSLIQGDKASVLTEPRSVVLTESTARKIFGKEDPVDKMIRFENDTSSFRITGISMDPPENSHFTYDILISMDAFWDYNSNFWLRNNLNTYVLLQNGFPYQDLEAKFPDMIIKYIGPQFQQTLGFSINDFISKGNYLEYRLQPIRDVHLDTSINHGLKPSVNRKYIYIFGLIAIFILLIAGINYINLSTARSARRAREIGLRKVFGSTRKRLILQFLGDSMLVSFVATVFAVVIAGIMLPCFNKITGLSFGLFSFSTSVLIFMMLGFIVIIGIFAGFYPAFLLSSYSPSSVLQNKHIPGSRGGTLRSILVVVQFFIAIMIMSGTLTIYQQLKFIQSKDLGFDKDEIMVIHGADALDVNISTFIEEVKKHAGVENIANSGSLPGFPFGDDVFIIDGRSRSETYVLQTSWVDTSYINTLKMKIVDGRNFSMDFGSDSLSVIINEAMVKRLELKDPLGTRLVRPGAKGNYTYYTVIGVVKDFHYQSLHKTVQPFMMFNKPVRANWGGFISIRLGKGDKTRYVHDLKNIWKQYSNDRPLEYSFLDEDIKRLYKEEIRTGILSMTFTILAIFIACLGLIGLISYTTVQRVKEIGLRKIMGASVWSILVLLSSETAKLIIVASLFAWPLAWLLLKDWLTDFAYRISLNPLSLILTSIVILVLSLVTIGGHVLYAASRNPADSLRYE